MKDIPGGQPNIAGINAQTWAAMSLFLQSLRDPRFSYIHLEAPRFQDFNLVFDDGKKTICESKDRKEKFSYGHLKKILKHIAKSKSFGDRDEILIICRSANEDLVSETENIKYYEQLNSKFKQKGYSDADIALLPRVKFWIVLASFNESAIYSLFADLINFWLSPEDIEKIVDHILVQKIYKGSAKGSTYSRADILKQISDLAIEARTNSVYYNDELRRREKQFAELNKALKNPKHATWRIPKELSAFSTDYERLKFAISRLTNKKNGLDLKNWNPVWQLNRIYHFTFGIFNVFRNNLHTKKNRKYVLDYIKKYIRTIRGFYWSDFFDVDVVEIITNIIEGKDGVKYLDDAFLIVEDLITFNEKEFFYIKDTGYDQGQWEKEEICKLLHRIYLLADGQLKERIFALLVTAFNITEDDSEFSLYSPAEVFLILADWLNEDFTGRFRKMVKTIANQYDKFYKTFSKKITFNGWEHMGGSVSFSGAYHASDRHFIGVLAPAIRKYYEQDPVKGWKFIKDKCINTAANVSKYKPDFLNRSVYQILLERYAGDDQKVPMEAFDILSEFILSKKGIPHKSDLIYQAVVSSNKLSNDKKWKLVEVTAKKYAVPVNPFAEQIVANLAKAGLQKAKDELKKWFGEPKYYSRFMFGEDAVSTIKTIIDTDLDFALELFRALLKSDYFKFGKSENLSPFTVAELLHNIIKKDYNKGLNIIRFLENEKALSKDLQTIYCFSLYNNHGDDDSDELDLLMKIYSDVVDPFLTRMGNNILRICERIQSDGARAALVQFAARLATKRKISEAVRIIRVFIDDPDPYLPGKDPNDHKDEYNEHRRIEEGNEPHTIRSVRGWCAWALMKCSVLEGRDQISEIIKLVKTLSVEKDSDGNYREENYYVIHMTCFALAQIAKNRLTVLPSDKNTLFFNDDKEKALRLAREVENIAFIMLDRFMSWPEPVRKAMAKSILHVFSPIRALNEANSLKLVQALSKLPKEALEESAPLFIYYAELRKDAYKEWKFSMPGLYDDLGPDKYDSGKFKNLLIEIIRRLQEIDPDSGFRFASSIEHMMREMAVKDSEDKYTKLALEYFDLLTGVYGHRIYSLIYLVIRDKLERSDKYTDKWYSLLIKCLKIEEDFYKKEVKAGSASKIHWYPTLHHPRILELVNEKIGQEKFMEAAGIFFLSP